MGAEIPGSIFEDLEGTTPVTPVRDGTLRWYDNIIDDMLANPGTNMTEVARRLGRAPATVHAICSSDLFKARWVQRRQQYEELLNQKLVAKLTRTADLALDCTIEVLQKKRDAVPLPILAELTKTALDRLGYAPSRSESPQVQVNLHNNVVSAEALAAAREKLRLVESVAVGPPDGREATVRKHQTEGLPREHMDPGSLRDGSQAPGEAWPSRSERPSARDPEPPVAGQEAEDGPA